MTFLVVDSNRHWQCISNLSLKNIKVKGTQCPDYGIKVSENLNSSALLQLFLYFSVQTGTEN